MKLKVDHELLNRGKEDNRTHVTQRSVRRPLGIKGHKCVREIREKQKKAN